MNDRARKGRVRAVCVREEGRLMWRLDDGSLHDAVLVGADVEARASLYRPGMVFLCAKPRKARKEEESDPSARSD